MAQLGSGVDLAELTGSCLACGSVLPARRSKYCTPKCARRAKFVRHRASEKYAARLARASQPATAGRRCDKPGCDRPHCAKGLCKMHYKQTRWKPVERVMLKCQSCGVEFAKNALGPSMFCSRR